ncbi:MAG: hypothetical protein ACXAC7_04700 [Candidatus Hodarchaeales archaeon]
MLQSYDVLPIIYNLGILTLFIFWLTRNNDRNPLEGWIKRGNLKLLWILFIVVLILSLVSNLTFLGSDVDDAVVSGTMAFSSGSNPYQEDVVVHFDRNGTKILGLYHYFPSDLLVYTVIYFLFGFLEIFDPRLFNSWFFIGNVIFLSLGYLLTRKIVDVPDNRLFPLYGLITSFFLFTNSSLALLYFLIGFYLFKRFKDKNEPYRLDFGIFSYIMSAGVKYIAGLLLVVHTLEDALTIRRLQDLRIIRPYLVGSVLFFLLILPFGFFDVLKATFLYQGEISARSEVAGVYGPILVEIMLFLDIIELYTVCFFLTSGICVIIAFRKGETTYERQMWLSYLFMFILPFYGTEFLIIPLILWFFSIFGFEINKQEKFIS